MGVVLVYHKTLIQIDSPHYKPHPEVHIWLRAEGTVVEPTLVYSGRVLRRFTDTEWLRCPYIGLITVKEQKSIENGLSNLLERVLEFQYDTNPYKKRFLRFFQSKQITKFADHQLRF